MRLSGLFAKFTATALVLTISAFAFFAFSQEIPKINDEIRVGISYGASSSDTVGIKSDCGFDIAAPQSDFQHYDIPSLTARATSSGITLSTRLGGTVASAAKGQEIVISNENSLLTVGNTSYRGKIILFVNSGGKITVVNELPVDEYLKGVLPYEVFTSWPEETLKTMAIVARTYAVKAMVSSSHASDGFDICASTHCQVYGGTAKETERTNKAVSDTSGCIITYNNEVATTPYFSSSGYYTESVSSGWGSSAELFPYLASVYNPYEDYRSISNGKWENVISKNELINHVSSFYREKLSGNITDISYERQENGYINSASITDSSGKTIKINTSGSVRSFFGDLVKSANFGIAETYVPSGRSTPALNVISASGTYDVTNIGGYDYIDSEGLKKCLGVESVYVFDGIGSGHGIGLSQYGAKYMADAGFSCEEIISTYFPGTDLTFLE